MVPMKGYTLYFKGFLVEYPDYTWAVCLLLINASVLKLAAIHLEGALDKGTNLAHI